MLPRDSNAHTVIAAIVLGTLKRCAIIAFGQRITTLQMIYNHHHHKDIVNTVTDITTTQRIVIINRRKRIMPKDNLVSPLMHGMMNIVIRNGQIIMTIMVLIWR